MPLCYLNRVKRSTSTYFPKDCKEGWRLFQGRCYRMFWEWLTWDAASQKCGAMGGALAKVDSREISDFLLKLTIW